MKKYLRELKTLDREKAIQIIGQVALQRAGVGPGEA